MDAISPMHTPMCTAVMSAITNPGMPDEPPIYVREEVDGELTTEVAGRAIDRAGLSIGPGQGFPDLREAGGGQGGATHQEPVHVRQRGKRRRVPGIHAASVENRVVARG